MGFQRPLRGSDRVSGSFHGVPMGFRCGTRDLGGPSGVSCGLRGGSREFQRTFHGISGSAEYQKNFSRRF